MATNNTTVKFTAQETDVIRHTVNGMTAKEIAVAMNISRRTVEFHLANAYDKAKVRGKVELVGYALKNGF